MNRPALRVLSTLAALGSTSWIPSARADPVEDAMNFFARGRDLRTHGDCADAVPLFRAAHEAYPGGLGSLRNIAECSETLRQYAAARTAWLDLQHALLATASPRYDGWAQDADSAISRLAQKVAGPNQELLDPRSVDLAARAANRVDLHVVRPSTEPAALATQPPRIAEGSGSKRKDAGWIAVGVGAASLAGAGISLAVFESARARLEQRCPNYRTQSCDPSLRPTVNEGNMAGTLVNVLAVAGIVGVAGGVVFLSLPATRNAQASLVVSPAGIWAAGKF